MKKLPSTSIDAFKQLHPEMLAEHHAKIISGLQKLKSGTYEELAAHLTLDKAQVGRRLSELERMELIYKNGRKKPTGSGRGAFVYFLRPDAILPEQFKKEEVKPTVEAPVGFIQKPLFE